MRTLVRSATIGFATGIRSPFFAPIFRPSVWWDNGYPLWVDTLRGAHARRRRRDCGRAVTVQDGAACRGAHRADAHPAVTILAGGPDRSSAITAKCAARVRPRRSGEQHDLLSP